MLAACAVVEAKPAAASAALPETKVRLFKISSLARTHMKKGNRGQPHTELIREMWRICQCARVTGNLNDI
jgi:hypothetical protein